MPIELLKGVAALTRPETMDRSPENIGYLDKLVKEMMANAAIAFMTLSVLVTLFSVFLVYEFPPRSNRPFAHNLISQNLTPLTNLIASAAPVFVPTAPEPTPNAALSTPQPAVGEVNPTLTTVEEKTHPDNKGAVRSAAAEEAKVLRTIEKEADRIFDDDKR